MDAPAALIMEKLSQGSLPVDDPLRFWTSYGTGRICDGRDEVISASVQEQSSRPVRVRRGSATLPTRPLPVKRGMPT